LRNTPAPDMERYQVIIFIQCRPVSRCVRGTIDAIRHIILTRIHQLDWSVYFLRYRRGLDHVVPIGPLSETATHPGQSDMYLFLRQPQPRSQRSSNEFRRLRRAIEFRLFSRDVRETIDGLHTIVRQVGGVVRALENFGGPLECRFRVTVFTEEISWLLSHLRHPFLMSYGTFQCTGNFHGLLAAPAVHHNVRIHCSLPFNFCGLLGVHHLPGGVTHDGDEFSEGRYIERVSFISILEHFYHDYILNAGHGLDRSLVYRFYFQPKGRGMDDHCD